MKPHLLNNLFTSLQYIPGMGPKTITHYERLVGQRILDVLWHLPVGIIKRRYIDDLRAAKVDDIITAIVTPINHKPPVNSFRTRTPYKVICQDQNGYHLDLVFFKAYQEYLLKMLPIGRKVLISGKFDKVNGVWQITHPDHIGKPEELDNWTGVEPIYPLTGGVTQKHMQTTIKKVLQSLPDLPEWIPKYRMQEQNWKSWRECVIGAHNPNSIHFLDPIHHYRKRLAYDELLANQLALQLVRRNHRKKIGRSLKGDKKLRHDLINKLSFNLTKAQLRSLQEIECDMEAPFRMIRLLQGDVGSGKTIVAMLTMLNAVECGAQAALLAPTEILAQQHYENLRRWGNDIGVNVGLLTSKGKGKSKTLKDIASGEINIVVATHAIIQKNVEFNDLAIAIVDEQHRFGVDQRLALAAKGEHVDLLVMTATPIPRTLMMASCGDLECSRLDEKPAGRLDIETLVVPLTKLDDTIAKIKNAIAAQRKIYWVCPLVEESEVLDLAAAEDRYQQLRNLFPGQVGMVHGRMKAEQKDEVMQKFQSGEFRVLVATTVIEVGVHVPDATVMLIEHAERFGLAQLHQLRGRIGRSELQSVCILMYGFPLTENAKARLSIMRDTNDGFLIAEEDLKLRGGGDTIGLKQSGMPTFKTANLEVHRDLLEMANEDAVKILKANSSISDAEEIKMLLFLHEKDKAVELITSG